MPDPDYKALCEELLVALKSWSPLRGGPLECWEDREEVAALIARAEAELAQHEPVVLTRPDCFNFAMDFLGGREEVEVRNYIERLESAAQAQPEPVAPTDEELYELWNSEGNEADFQDCRRFARALLDQQLVRRTYRLPEPVAPTDDALDELEARS